ncbi:MAG TPA: chemotaxis protein CheB [bacterium]|nr:chemotaxis protein CheB [bacterium]
MSNPRTLSREKPHPHRDIVVIGASMGGVDALKRLVLELPGDLPATIFVVQHMGLGAPGVLAEILSRGAMRATYAIHNEKFHPGRIYLAPGDNHLMIRLGYMHVARGPRENGHRPSVDALFRSASRIYGPRVIAVVLTGLLDCGTAGAISVKARGGLVIAQDPKDAEFPDMPSSVIQHAGVDHVVSLKGLGPLLNQLVREPPNPQPNELPDELAEFEGDEIGISSEIVCPLCQGKLTEAQVGGFRTFRCHVGHAFSEESLVAEQADEVERALWAAIRALEEGAMLSARVARQHHTRDIGQRFQEKEDIQYQQAQLLRRMVMGSGMLSREDATEAEQKSE